MSPQECLSQQQALSAVRQMQKLLAAQEAAHLRGTRGLQKQLSILQSRLQRQATKRNGNPGQATAAGVTSPWGQIPQTTGEQPGQGTPSSSPALALAPAWRCPSSPMSICPQRPVHSRWCP